MWKFSADKAGRWWIVGSAWAGKQQDNPKDSESALKMTSEDAAKHAKLMKRAKAQGMNTDTRKNIFCILMTAEVSHEFLINTVVIGIL